MYGKLICIFRNVRLSTAWFTNFPYIVLYLRWFHGQVLKNSANMCSFGSKYSSILTQYNAPFTVEILFKLGGIIAKRSREEMAYNGNKISMLGTKFPHIEDFTTMGRTIFSETYFYVLCYLMQIFSRNGTDILTVTVCVS